MRNILTVFCLISATSSRLIDKAYLYPVEAKLSVVVGTVAIIFMVVEITMFVLMDCSAYYRSVRLCRKRVWRLKKIKCKIHNNMPKKDMISLNQNNEYTRRSSEVAFIKVSFSEEAV